jgi:hypothetical protein
MSFEKRCRGVTRRSFLVDTGMGFTGLALGSTATASPGGSRRPDGPTAGRTSRRGPARSSGFSCAAASATSRASTPSRN